MSLLTTLSVSSEYERLVNIPSLQVHLDAIASPIIKDGSNNVSQWSDISGNGNHALRVGSDLMPIYVSDKDGYPAIYSDGTSGRKLDFSHSVTNNDNFTVIALFSADTSMVDPSIGSSLNVFLSFGGADTSDNSVGLRQKRDELNSVSYVAYGDGSTIDGSPFSGFEAFSISYDGTNTYAYYGNDMDNDSGDAASASRVFGDGRLFNENPASSSRTGIGWLRSLLLFKEHLSDEKRNSIVAAMKNRYGVV